MWERLKIWIIALHVVMNSMVLQGIALYVRFPLQDVVDDTEDG
jgi:hypothetical protein